jgi:hypothetical protein
LAPILVSLHQLELRLGLGFEARATAEQGAEVIRYIAEHTPADLRSSFLVLPQVAALLTHAA